ncbi:hypothetical protein [Labilibaculum manganireducens]|uniref:hypothetical protein n=1 Tax=Labilibaculum manganireducens TaxID=1940525 RepID=UPI0029F5AEEF|nr:hypothetical protein [Labilibaculum manganireducens]
MKKKHLFGHSPSDVWKKTVRVMKLTAVLLFLVVFSVSAEGFSQGSNISMRMENASLKEVFQELTSLSEYTFVYSEKMISGTEPSSHAVNYIHLISKQTFIKMN